MLQSSFFPEMQFFQKVHMSLLMHMLQEKFAVQSSLKYLNLFSITLLKKAEFGKKRG